MIWDFHCVTIPMGGIFATLRQAAGYSNFNNYLFSTKALTGASPKVVPS